uniref:Phosphatidylserine decarboxylase proenzyme n=1 Tax=Lygus hesperus TaxID=30085 RepID=A0A0A9X0A8_LYGHE
MAPCSFRCSESVYVPGSLFPVTAASLHYLPGVLTINERVILHGSLEPDSIDRGSNLSNATRNDCALSLCLASFFVTRIKRTLGMTGTNRKTTISSSTANVFSRYEL